MWGCAYQKIGDDDLHDLGLQARPASEGLLEEGNHHMAQRRANECAVDRHLGHTACEVVAALVTVFRNPRGEELLKGGEGTGCEHLRLQGVLLELLQVPLTCHSC